MKSFVDSIHAIGMKFMLWYSLPFVGSESAAYKQFAGKFINDDKNQGRAILDPRYPEVRRYLIDTYVSAMNEWGLDGFKLDFVDNFKNYNNTPEYNKEMDYWNVFEASDRLMSDISKALTSENSEVLIEFRQQYIGPLMRKYGNMFRASDCPYSINENRMHIADIRLLAGTTATHADMLMWHPEEDVEVAALQLLNVMFSVPQISIRMSNYPPSHNAMLKFWLAFWNLHKYISYKIIH
jgi:alpha-galactosidase